MITQIEDMRRAQSIQYKIYELKKKLVETKKNLVRAHEAEKIY